MKLQKEKISGIYQIRSIKTGKLYIGSSIDINKRFSQHKSSLQKGNHHSTKLQRSYNATKDKSAFVFEIVEIVSDITILKEREQFYIDKYDSFNTGYNCSALVDNLKYVEKNIKKKRQKLNQINSYKMFWELYNKSLFKIGNKFIHRAVKPLSSGMGSVNTHLEQTINIKGRMVNFK